MWRRVNDLYRQQRRELISCDRVSRVVDVAHNDNVRLPVGMVQQISKLVEKCGRCWAGGGSVDEDEQ